jgi:hypothetical protein
MTPDDYNQDAISPQDAERVARWIDMPIGKLVDKLISEAELLGGKKALDYPKHKQLEEARNVWEIKAVLIERCIRVPHAT